MNNITPIQASFATCLTDLCNPSSWINTPTMPSCMKPIVGNIQQKVLKGAIETQNLFLITMLRQRGANFNWIDPDDGTTPLGAALRARNPQIISFLIDQGADPNLEDALGHTPLLISLQLRDPRLIHLIRCKGADLNKPNTAGYTPLTETVSNNNVRDMQNLLRFGADIDKPDADGMTPLAQAYCDNKSHIAQQLLSLGADISLSREIILAKSLGAVWGLDGQISLKDAQQRERTVVIDGFCSNFTYSLLIQYVRIFFSSNTRAQNLSAQEKKVFLETLHRGCITIEKESAANLFQKIQHNTPFVMLQHFPSHVLGILISKNQIIICDRSDDDMMSNGAAIYSLNTAELTLPRIQQLQAIQSMSDLTDFLEDLKASPLQMQLSDVLEQHPQNAENCTWTSLKTLFLALLYTVTEDRIKETKERKTFAFSLYKCFTAFVRSQLLYTYLQSSKQPSDDLLGAILDKIDFKIHIPQREKTWLSTKIQSLGIVKKDS